MLSGISFTESELILMVGLYILFTAIVVFFYRFSNKKLIKKIKELRKKDAELYALIEKLNNSVIEAEKRREIHKAPAGQKEKS